MSDQAAYVDGYSDGVFVTRKAAACRQTGPSLGAYVVHGQAFREAIGDRLHQRPRKGPNDIDRRIGDALAVALEAAAPYIEAEARAAERQRIRRSLIDGDPGVLESELRQFLDDEEAAEAAGLVADLLEDPDVV